MSESYVEAKVVLENAKSSTWKFFKFRVAAGEVDRSYVHCKLCLDDGQRKKGLIVCLFVRETYTCSGLVRLVMRKMRWMLSWKGLKQT